MEENFLKILNIFDLSFNSLSELENVKISREKLINPDLYEKTKTDIMKFKKELSSSFYTCLHNEAEKKQKWPLINFIRQVLRHYKYKLVPIRECDGYTKERKKRYKRFFVIKRCEKK